MTNIMKNKLATCREQIQTAYANGATLREIGEVHNVSAGTVRNCLIEAGVSLRPRGRRKSDSPKPNNYLELNDLEDTTNNEETE